MFKVVVGGLPSPLLPGLWQGRDRPWRVDTTAAEKDATTRCGRGMGWWAMDRMIGGLGGPARSGWVAGAHRRGGAAKGWNDSGERPKGPSRANRRSSSAAGFPQGRGGLDARRPGRGWAGTRNCRWWLPASFVYAQSASLRMDTNGALPGGTAYSLTTYVHSTCCHACTHPNAHARTHARTRLMQPRPRQAINSMLARQATPWHPTRSSTGSMAGLARPVTSQERPSLTQPVSIPGAIADASGRRPEDLGRSTCVARQPWGQEPSTQGFPTCPVSRSNRALVRFAGGWTRRRPFGCQVTPPLKAGIASPPSTLYHLRPAVAFGAEAQEA